VGSGTANERASRAAGREGRQLSGSTAVVERSKAAFAWLRARPRLLTGLQVGALGVLLVFLVLALRGSWHRAEPRLRHADWGDVAIAIGFITAYYLSFVVGWLWILRGLGIRLRYGDALRAEMVSMLAKYVPGGVWTPAARVVAVRRAGVEDTSLVLASIALEAGLSAVAGVFVFVISLPTVGHVDRVTTLLVVAFGVLLAVILHPRLFGRVASFLLKPLGAAEIPALSYRRTIQLLGYYCCTWIIGGAALYFLLRAVGGDPSASAIPFLGGASAVGAIVAVIVVFAPSGLGVREGATYALLRIVAGSGPALGAVILNRLAITLVEGALFVVAPLLLRRRRARRHREIP
jgi:glycosyltransferase 2 family protein